MVKFKNIIKILISLMLVLMMTFSFCACDSDDDSSKKDTKKESSKNDDEDDEEETDEDEVEKEDEDEDEDEETSKDEEVNDDDEEIVEEDNKEENKKPEKEEIEEEPKEEDKKPASLNLTGLSVEKINTKNIKGSVSIVTGGVYYRDQDSKKYGVMTFDGKKDTGAIYAMCENEKKYFIVLEQAVTNFDDIDAVNSKILINAEGKQLVGPEYADYKVINDRFVQAFVATQQTPHKAEAVISTSGYYFGNREFNELYYKGVWYIIDLTTGQRVPGATATNTYSVSANDGFIEFYDDAKNQICIDAKGNKIDKTKIRIFTDGSYKVSLGYNVGTIYDKDNNKLFDYNKDTYEPVGFEGDLYYASKYKENNLVYVLLDKTGKKVSAEFDEYFSVYGEFILCDERVYDFNGNKVIDIKAEYMYCDEDFDKAYCLKDNDEYTFITKDGTVIYSGEYDDDIYISGSGFVSYKRVGSEDFYYSYADKDYKIKGSSIGPWMVKEHVDTKNYTYIYDLVDVITGKKLLTGYETINYVKGEDGKKYIYAEKNETYDIYEVK